MGFGNVAMKIRYPDKAIVRLHPPLAGLSENAVYVLLMRRRGSVRIGVDGINWLAILILFLGGGVVFFGPWNSPWIRFVWQIAIALPAYVIYRIERAMRVKLSRDFLGFTLEEADQYALLPISAEDVVVAHWGEATLFRPRLAGLVLCCGGFVLLLIGLLFGSWMNLLGAGALMGIAGYWMGVEKNWGARALVKTAVRAWKVRHSHSTNKERQRMRWDYRSDARLIGWIFIPGAILFITWIYMTASWADMANQLPRFILAGGLVVVMAGWGYLTGLNVGWAAWDESNLAFKNAIYNTEWIQREMFEASGGNEKRSP